MRRFPQPHFSWVGVWYGGVIAYEADVVPIVLVAIDGKYLAIRKEKISVRHNGCGLFIWS